MRKISGKTSCNYSAHHIKTQSHHHCRKQGMRLNNYAPPLRYSEPGVKKFSTFTGQCQKFKTLRGISLVITSLLLPHCRTLPMQVMIPPLKWPSNFCARIGSGPVENLRQ